MGRWGLLAGKMLVTGLLLYVAMHDTDFGAVWERWRQLDALWLLPAAALMVLQLIVAAWRWHVVGHALDEPTPFRHRAWILLISTFFNQTLPSFVGGDAMRIWLTRNGHGGVRAACHAVLIDRGAGLLGVLLLVALCLPGSWSVVGDAAGRWALALIVAGGFAGAALFFLVGSGPGPRRDTWRPLAMIVSVAGSARAVVLSTDPGLRVWSASLVVHLLTVGIVLCLAWGLAIGLDPLMALFLIPTVMLISFLPITVAGWGLREGAMITALAYLGIAAPDALALSVLFGLAFLAQGALGGLAWLVAGAQRPQPVETLVPHAE